MEKVVFASRVLVMTACTPPESSENVEVDPAAQIAEPATAAATVAEAKTVAPKLRVLDEAALAEKATPSPNYSLESLGDDVFVDEDMILPSPFPSAVKANGWLKAERADAAVDGAAIRILSKSRSQAWEMPLVYGRGREDFSAGSTGSGAAYGFEAELDANSMPVGRYHVCLAYRVDGALFSCDNGRHISLL